MRSSNTVNNIQSEEPTIEMIEATTIKKIERADFLINALSKMAMNHDKTIQLTKNRVSIIEKKLDQNENLFKRIGSYKERLNKLNTKVAKLNEKLESKNTQVGDEHQVSNDKINEIKANIQLIEATKNKIEEKIVHFSKKIYENRDDVFLDKSYLKNSIDKIDLNLEKRKIIVPRYKDEIESIFSYVEYTVEFLNVVKKRSELPVGDENKVVMPDKDKDILLKLEGLYEILKKNRDTATEMINSYGEKIQVNTTFITEKYKYVNYKISFFDKCVTDYFSKINDDIYSPKVNLPTTNILVNCIGTLKTMSDNSQSSALNCTSNSFSTSTIAVIKH